MTRAGEPQGAPEGPSADPPRVAVVVPTYNEAENLPDLARRLFALDVPGLWLVVVDDASPDGTEEVAQGLSERYGGRVRVLSRTGKQGLGTAYAAGFRLALEMGAERVVQMDADLSHAPEQVPALLTATEAADVAVGSRYVHGGGADPSWGRRRRLLSWLGNFGIRLVAGVQVRDATSGFKAFRRTALAGLNLDRFRCKGFAFQAEVAHACQARGYRVVEHPIVFTDRTRGTSKMSVGIVAEALWRLLPLRWAR